MNLGDNDRKAVKAEYNMRLARYKAATLLTSMAGAEGASPETETAAWAHVTQPRSMVVRWVRPTKRQRLGV